MARLQICCLALLAVVSAACLKSVTTPTATAAPATAAYTLAQLEGTWTVTAIQIAGGARQDRPFTATYTVTFRDGRLSSRADCNSCAGAFSVAGTMLSAGPALACTRAACPTQTFENAYTAILNGDSMAEVTNSTLTLSSSRGTIWLVRQS